MTSVTARLAGLAEAFAGLLEDGDLAAPVAACPGWDVRALADHLGGVHAWATHAVTHGSPDHVEPAAPTDGLADWYRERVASLLDALAVDGPAWAMDPANRTVAFWRTRQLHEVRMHLWDARTALGAPDEIEPDLAHEGLCEVRDVVYPRQVRLGRVAPLASTLVLDATDAAPVRMGSGPETVVRGRASDLLLQVWHRVDTAEPLLRGALVP